jgi:hypothetical protein
MRSRVAVLATAVGLSVAITTPGFAQAKRVPVPPMEFGLMGGVNIFTVGGSDATGAKSRTSFFGGASLMVPLGQMFFVEPQILFSGEGATYTDTSVTSTLKLSYVQVPVLLGVNIGGTERSGLRVFAGPMVAFKVGCTAEGSGGGLTVSGSCSDIGLDVKSTDFGVTGGAGFTIRGNRFNLNVFGRYTLGLAKVITDFDIKNQGFSIGAGLSFPFKRK